MAKGKASEIVLSAEERRELELLARRRTAQGLVLRARIVLAAAEGSHNGPIAERWAFAGARSAMARTVCSASLDGLYDEPRPGAPRQIGDDEIAETIGGRWRRACRSHALELALDGQGGRAMRRRPCIASGGRSACSRTAARPSSSRPIRCSSRRCATSSGSTLTPPERAWCCASTRRARSRRSTARSRCCRCGPARPSGAPTTTSATARRRCSPRSTWRPGRSSASAAAPPRARVPQVPRHHRGQRADRSRHPPRHGQLRHPQDQADPRLVRQAAALARPLHARPRRPGSIRSNASSPADRRADPPRRASLDRALEAAIHAYIDAINADPKPFRWTKTADDILAAIQRFCIRTLNSDALQRTSEIWDTSAARSGRPPHPN